MNYNTLNSFDFFAEKYSKIIFLDTETTGLRFDCDRIIQLGVVECDSRLNQINTISKYINNEILIPKEITRLTGITQSDVEKGIYEYELLEIIEKLFCRRNLIIAYNAQFDLMFIHELLKRHRKEHLISNCDYLDVMTIFKDRANYPHKLKDAISYYRLSDKVSNSHSALEDVIATKEVFEAMCWENNNEDEFVNRFGYNPKYGMSGQSLANIRYFAQPFKKFDHSQCEEISHYEKLCRMYKYAKTYYDGIGVRQNFKLAFHWFSMLEEDEFKDSLTYLSTMMIEQKGYSGDPYKGVQILSKLANDSPYLSYLLGSYYLNGNFLKKDIVKAYYWYGKSASLGYPDSQFNIGLFFYKGDIVTQDYEIAFSYFLSAARQGHVISQFNVGVCYMTGIGTERNVEESLKWLQKADENGNIDATVFLGKYNLETGKISLGVSQIKKAAESGHSKAQFILSIMYKNGEGVEKNPELELYWCEQSANSGDSDAQYNLACLHFERGDDETAVDLLLRSAEQGNEHAIDYINDINSLYKNYINSL